MRSLLGLSIFTVAAVAACGGGSDEPVAAGSATDEAMPSCEEIEAFAAVLDDTGIAYDYDPSDSPAGLAEGADAVFSGRLTGNLTFDTQTATEDTHPWTFTGFEIDVTHVAKGEPEVQPGDTTTVYAEYLGAHVSQDQFRDAAAPGTPVVVFAGHHQPLGELTAFMTEGFMTACPGGPLLGRFGTQGSWAGLDTLDAVIQAAGPDAVATPDPTAPVTSDPAPSSIPTTSTAAVPPEEPTPQPAGVPDREPDVTGSVGTDDNGRPGVLADPSDSYFTGMHLNRGEPIVFDIDAGTQLDFADLSEGDRIAVWIDGGCAESFPVQCNVTAIGVSRGR